MTHGTPSVIMVKLTRHSSSSLSFGLLVAARKSMGSLDSVQYSSQYFLCRHRVFRWCARLQCGGIISVASVMVVRAKPIQCRKPQSTIKEGPFYFELTMNFKTRIANADTILPRRALQIQCAVPLNIMQSQD